MGHKIEYLNIGKWVFAWVLVGYEWRIGLAMFVASNIDMI